MRHKGILTTRREGVNIYYRVANPKVIDACTLMKEVLFETAHGEEESSQRGITACRRGCPLFLTL